MLMVHEWGWASKLRPAAIWGDNRNAEPDDPALRYFISDSDLLAKRLPCIRVVARRGGGFLRHNDPENNVDRQSDAIPYGGQCYIISRHSAISGVHISSPGMRRNHAPWRRMKLWVSNFSRSAHASRLALPSR